MQNDERARVARLFNRRGLENEAHYRQVLSNAQGILEAVSAGQTRKALELYNETFEAALPDQNEFWMEHLLLFRQMQACMVLGLLLHHGYLISLPVQALHTVLEDAVNRLMYLKDPDEAGKVLRDTITDLSLLVSFQPDREHHPAVQKAIEAMEGCHEMLTAEQLAEKAGMSAGHLNQLFRRCTGKTIREYQMDTRLQMARLMLLTTEKTVSEIASELGFSSASHLGSLFKAQNGLTPTQYRVQQRRIGEMASEER